ncbi:hypothetical protein ABIE67_005005 [Streptomyces sp. V4I8]|uniref:hypothetical protein n=1 Tax=Streptomyces sp. V4I8 TaxID=3156469 RepID=UPI003512684D
MDGVGADRGHLRQQTVLDEHSDEERQEEVAADLDVTVRKAREEAARKAGEKPSGPDLARGE